MKKLKNIGIIALAIIILFGCEEVSTYDKNNKPRTIYERLDDIEYTLDYIDSALVLINSTNKNQNRVDSLNGIRITNLVNHVSGEYKIGDTITTSITHRNPKEISGNLHKLDEQTIITDSTITIGNQTWKTKK